MTTYIVNVTPNIDLTWNSHFLVQLNNNFIDVVVLFFWFMTVYVSSIPLTQQYLPSI